MTIKNLKGAITPSLIKYIHNVTPQARASQNSHYVMYGRRQVGYENKADEKKEIISWINDACFYRFKGIIQKARLFINQHKRYADGSDEQKVMLEWFEYVTKRSPFRISFKNVKKQEDYLRDGIAINCKQGPNVVIAGMIAVREGWEYTGCLWSWDWFRKNGFTEDEAYLCSLFWQKKNLKSGNFRWNIMGSGHRVCEAAYLSQEDCRRFLRGEFVDLKEKPVSEGCWGWSTPNLMSKEQKANNGIAMVLKTLGKMQGEGWDAKFDVPVDEITMNKLKEMFRAE